MDRDDIFARAAARYGVEPEYLWASAPNYAVLRRSDSRKWFGIIMDVPRPRLKLPGEGVQDILDIRCDPLMLGSLLEQPGFLPAYHMHKGNWITVVLDSGADPETVQSLLEISYDLAAGKKGKR